MLILGSLSDTAGLCFCCVCLCVGQTTGCWKFKIVKNLRILWTLEFHYCEDTSLLEYYKSTQSNIPEDLNLQQHVCKNLKSRVHCSIHKGRHWFISWSTWNYHTPLISVFIVLNPICAYGLSRSLLSSGLPNKALYFFCLFPTRAAWPIRLIIFHFIINLIISGEDGKSRSFLFYKGVALKKN